MTDVGAAPFVWWWFFCGSSRYFIGDKGQLALALYSSYYDKFILESNWESNLFLSSIERVNLFDFNGRPSRLDRGPFLLNRPPLR